MRILASGPATPSPLPDTPPLLQNSGYRALFPARSSPRSRVQLPGDAQHQSSASDVGLGEVPEPRCPTRSACAADNPRTRGRDNITGLESKLVNGRLSRLLHFSLLVAGAEGRKDLSDS